MTEVIGEFTVSSAGNNTVVDYNYPNGVETMSSTQARIMREAAIEVVRNSPGIDGVRIVFTEGRLDVG